MKRIYFLYIVAVALKIILSSEKWQFLPFFEEWKNFCSSKFVQLELLNEAKARTSRNYAA